MEDVLAVYQRPYDPQRPQVCLDEGRKELPATPRGTLPRQPGQSACADYEYMRHGACSYFLAIDALRGWRRVWVSERRTKLDLAHVLRQLVDEVYPAAEQIVRVTDNLNLHHPACLYERFAPAEARRIAAKRHYTPTQGSWLDIAECELSVLTRQCLNRRLPDIETVRSEVNAWQTQRKAHSLTVNWRFTTSDARIKLKHLYPTVNKQIST